MTFRKWKKESKRIAKLYGYTWDYDPPGARQAFEAGQTPKEFALSAYFQR